MEHSRHYLSKHEKAIKQFIQRCFNPHNETFHSYKMHTLTAHTKHENGESFHVTKSHNAIGNICLNPLESP